VFNRDTAYITQLK